MSACDGNRQIGFVVFRNFFFDRFVHLNRTNLCNLLLFRFLAGLITRYWLDYLNKLLNDIYRGVVRMQWLFLFSTRYIFSRPIVIYVYASNIMSYNTYSIYINSTHYGYNINSQRANRTDVKNSLCQKERRNETKKKS